MDRDEEKRFWETLFAGRVFDPDRPNKFKAMEPADIEAAIEWWKWLRRRQPLAEHDRLVGRELNLASWKDERNGTVDRMVHLLISQRRFFITSRGRLATGWASTQEGDEIHVVNGCSLPLILRPATGNTSQKSPHRSGQFLGPVAIRRVTWGILMHR